MQLAQYTTDLAHMLIEAENSARDAAIERANLDVAAKYGDLNAALHAARRGHEFAAHVIRAEAIRRKLYMLIDDEWETLEGETGR